MIKHLEIKMVRGHKLVDEDVRRVRIQSYPMGMCMWRDVNIVKTVTNVSDIACKSFWWFLDSYVRETNVVNNQKKARSGIRYDKIQI